MSVLILEVPARGVMGLLRFIGGFFQIVGMTVVGLFRMSIRQYAMLGLAVLLVALSALQVGGIDHMRNRMRGATLLGNVDEGVLPPDVLLLRHALGGFKTIFIDLVWQRAVKHLNSKQFFELYQLYDWIAKLHPRSEKIWVHNAWNMAYNIVAEVNDPEQRWMWIDRAIKWLRDRGLAYNPRSAAICNEMAFIYWHKMGRGTDNYNMYYKHRLALELTRVMGGSRFHPWPLIAEWPRDLDGLLEGVPAQRLGSDEKIIDVDAETVRKRLEVLVRDLGRTFAYHEVRDQRKAAMNLLRNVETCEFYDRLPVKLIKFLDNKEYRSQQRVLVEFIAARVLRERWKLDARTMGEIETQWKPMDWRLPEPHAIYWSVLGKRFLEGRAAVAHSAKMRAELADQHIDHERIMFDSLKQLYRRGILAYMDPVPNGNMMLTYDFGRIEQLHQMYVEKITREQIIQDHLDAVWRARRKAGAKEIPKDVRGLQSTKDGHIYFLQEVVENLYYAGKEQQAVKYYHYAQMHYNKFKTKEGKPVSMAEYCLGKIKDLVEISGNSDQVKFLCSTMVVKHLKFYASYQDEIASVWARKSQEFWRYYVDDFIQRDQDRTKRDITGLPTFDQIYRDELRNVLLGRRGFPYYLRERLRRRMGLAKDWATKASKDFDINKASEKDLRKEAYRKAYSPLPKPKEKSEMEKEQERREREEKMKKRRHRH